jgi:hypothetical protein
MEPKVKLPGHPDAVFGTDEKPTLRERLTDPEILAEGKRSAIMKPLLTDEVAALAASLNLPTPQGNNAYEPDAFVQAIRKTHDQLMEIKATLTKRNEEQRAKEASLAQREALVAFREKRVGAHEELKQRPWWRL